MKRQLLVFPCLLSVLLVAVVLVSYVATSGKVPVAEPAVDTAQALTEAGYTPVCVGEGKAQIEHLPTQGEPSVNFDVFVVTPPNGCGYTRLYCVLYGNPLGRSGLSCIPVVREGGEQ